MALNHNNSGLYCQHENSHLLPNGTRIDYVDLCSSQQESQSILDHSSNLNKQSDKNGIFQFNWYSAAMQAIPNGTCNLPIQQTTKDLVSTTDPVDTTAIMRNLYETFSSMPMPQDPISFYGTNGNHILNEDAFDGYEKSADNLQMNSIIMCDDSETQELESHSQSILGGCNANNPFQHQQIILPNPNLQNFALPKPMQQSNSGSETQMPTEEDRKAISKRMKEKLEKSVAILHSMPPEQDHFKYVEEMTQSLIADVIPPSPLVLYFCSNTYAMRKLFVHRELSLPPCMI